MSTFVDYWLRLNNPIFGLAPEKYTLQLDRENWQVKGLKTENFYYYISDSCPQGRHDSVFAIGEYDCDTQRLTSIIVDDLGAALKKANELFLEKQATRHSVSTEMSLAVGRKLVAALPVVNLCLDDAAII